MDEEPVVNRVGFDHVTSKPCQNLPHLNRCDIPLLRYARVRDPVRERMRLGGIEAVVGSTNFHERVTDGVRASQEEEG
jgi:hypothetical protein